MNVEEFDDFTAVVPVIDDGDTCGNQEHLATAQALTNRTKNLNRRTDEVESVTRGTLDPVILQPGSVAAALDALALPNESKLGSTNAVGRMGRGLAGWVAWLRGRVWGGMATSFPMTYPVNRASGANWVGTATTNQFYWVQTTTGADVMWWSLPPLPPQSWLKSFSVWLGAVPTTTHAALPATKPTLSIYRQLGDASAQIGTTSTDPSGTTGAYDAVHAITVTPAAAEFGQHGVIYHCKLTGEGGAGAEASKLAVFLATVDIASAP